jgi:hypothetical protein
MFAAQPFLTILMDAPGPVADAVTLGIQRKRAKDALQKAKAVAEAAVHVARSLEAMSRAAI